MAGIKKGDDRRRRVLYGKEALRKIRELGLKEEGLEGIVAYWDGRIFGKELSKWLVKNIVEMGGDIINGAKAEQNTVLEGNLHQVKVTDVRANRQYALKSKTVVRALGPWLEGVRKQRGTHLIVNRRVMEKEESIIRPASNGSVLFILPYGDGDKTLIGTTDVQTYNNPDEESEVSVEEDKGYLIQEANRNIREDRRIKEEDIVGVYWGMRASSTQKGEGVELSREAGIEVKDGVVTLRGTGKLTSAEMTGENLAEAVIRQLAQRSHSSSPLAKPHRFATGSPLYSNPRLTVRDLKKRLVGQTFTDDAGSGYEIRVKPFMMSFNAPVAIEAVVVDAPDIAENYPYIKISVEWHKGYRVNIIKLLEINTALSGLAGRGVARSLLERLGAAVPDNTIIAYSPPSEKETHLARLVESAGFLWELSERSLLRQEVFYPYIFAKSAGLTRIGMAGDGRDKDGSSVSSPVQYRTVSRRQAGQAAAFKNEIDPLLRQLMSNLRQFENPASIDEINQTIREIVGIRTRMREVVRGQKMSWPLESAIVDWLFNSIVPLMFYINSISTTRGDDEERFKAEIPALYGRLHGDIESKFEDMLLILAWLSAAEGKSVALRGSAGVREFDFARLLKRIKSTGRQKPGRASERGSGPWRISSSPVALWRQAQKRHAEIIDKIKKINSLATRLFSDLSKEDQHYYEKKAKKRLLMYHLANIALIGTVVLGAIYEKAISSYVMPYIAPNSCLMFLTAVSIVIMFLSSGVIAIYEIGELLKWLMGDEAFTDGYRAIRDDLYMEKKLKDIKALDAQLKGIERVIRIFRHGSYKNRLFVLRAIPKVYAPKPRLPPRWAKRFEIWKTKAMNVAPRLTGYINVRETLRSFTQEEIAILFTEIMILRDDDQHVRAAALKAIQYFLKADPSLAAPAFKTLNKMLDKDPDAAIAGLRRLAKGLRGLARRELALNILVAFLKYGDAVHGMFTELAQEGFYPDVVYNRASTVYAQKLGWPGWAIGSINVISYGFIEGTREEFKKYGMRLHTPVNTRIIIKEGAKSDKFGFVDAQFAQVENERRLQNFLLFEPGYRAWQETEAKDAHSGDPYPLGIASNGYAGYYLMPWGEAMSNCMLFGKFREDYQKTRSMLQQDALWKLYHEAWNKLWKETRSVFDIVMFRRGRNNEGQMERSLQIKPEFTEKVMARTSLSKVQALKFIQIGLNTMDVVDVFKLGFLLNYYYWISGHKRAGDVRFATFESLHKQTMVKDLEELVNAPRQGRQENSAASGQGVSFCIPKDLAGRLSLKRAFYEENIPVRDGYQLLEYLETVGWVPAGEGKPVSPLAKKSGFTLKILEGLKSGKLVLKIKDGVQDTVYDMSQAPDFATGASLTLDVNARRGTKGVAPAPVASLPQKTSGEEQTRELVGGKAVAVDVPHGAPLKPEENPRKDSPSKADEPKAEAVEFSRRLAEIKAEAVGLENTLKDLDRDVLSVTETMKQGEEEKAGLEGAIHELKSELQRALADAREHLAGAIKASLQYQEDRLHTLLNTLQDSQSKKDKLEETKKQTARRLEEIRQEMAEMASRIQSGGEELPGDDVASSPVRGREDASRLEPENFYLAVVSILGSTSRDVSLGRRVLIWTNTTPEPSSSIFFANSRLDLDNSGSESTRNTISLLGGSLSPTSGLATMYLENSEEISRFFSNNSFSVISCLLKEFFSIKLPVIFKVFFSKNKRLIAVLQEKRSLLHPSVVMNKIAMSESMSRIVTNHRVPFLIMMYFQLDAEIYNFLFKMGMLVPSAAISIQTYDKFFHFKINHARQGITPSPERVKNLMAGIQELSASSPLDERGTSFDFAQEASRSSPRPPLGEAGGQGRSSSPVEEDRIKPILSRLAPAGTPQLIILKKAQKGIGASGGRLGIFGSMCNPLTTTHMELINEAVKTFQLDEIVIVVTKNPPYRREIEAPLHDRLRMLELFSLNKSKMSLAVDNSGDFLDMARLLKDKYPSGTELYFITGLDTMEAVTGWPPRASERYLKDLFTSAHFIVAPRGSRLQQKRLRARMRMYIRQARVKDLAESRIKEMPFADARREDSSDQVRQLIRQGHNVRAYVPGGIFNYRLIQLTAVAPRCSMLGLWKSILRR
ncbi:MAG: FAD-dependent oxidoreductase [Candidatus Omnitrophica bacterium]|nr:FAD-dependent oxidoreductase [Candidatus Omnitrophota bacterium]